VDAMRERAPDVAAFARAMESRLRAMAGVHDLLAGGNWQALELRELVESLLDAASPMAHAIPVELHGPPVMIGPERAMPLALTLMEWFSNSSKYGAHSTPHGRLRITWELAESADRVRLWWTESGGPPITGTITPSLGMALVQGFASRELGGTCQMTFPATGADHTIGFAIG
jgi:two-component sensor histidine kinase